MKYTIRLLLALSTIIPVSVWASPFGSSEQYVNLAYEATGKALYLELSDKGCNSGTPVSMTGVSAVALTCVNSEKVSDRGSVAKAIAKVLSGDMGTKKWNRSPASSGESSALILASDIDFGETYDETKEACSVNHTPIEFSGLVFDGNGMTVSNLCSVQKMAKDSMGLFSRIENGTVRDLKISNVNFIVSKEWGGGKVSTFDAPDDIKDYKPVGALAGSIVGSVVQSISLAEITIKGPFAGGLVGYIEDSEVADIQRYKGTKPINVSNDITIKQDQVGASLSSLFPSYTYKVPSYKVALGGIAGIAVQTNFHHIVILLNLKNEAATEGAALGGLAAVYAYSSSKSTKEKYEISRVYINSELTNGDFVMSGGSAMGGLFGITDVFGPTDQIVSDMIIQDVNVSKLKMSNSGIEDNAKPLIYWGGIVGKGNLCEGRVLDISKAKVPDFSISDDPTGNGTFIYYVGGIAGYAGCEYTHQSSSDDHQYLSLKNSMASGTIDLKNDGGNGSKDSYSFSGYVGGLVGKSVLAMDEKSVMEDTAKVSITYKFKKKLLAGDIKTGYKAYVGGLFGAASHFKQSNDPIHMDKLVYEGSMSVWDDGIESYVGGVLGRFPDLQNSNPQISFDDVRVRGTLTETGSDGGKTLIEYEGIGTPTTTSFIGGICGECSSVKSLSKIAVEGNIEKREKLDDKTFYVGGLIGQSNTDFPLNASNTYSNGTITSTFTNAGYLYGSVLGGGISRNGALASNFHYGKDVLKAIGLWSGSAFKSFEDVGKFVNAEKNVRNGSTFNLSANKNGILPSMYMESSDFAALLNSSWDDAKSQVWAYSNDKAGLPYFGTPPVLTVLVTFMANSDVVLVKDADGNDVEAQKLSIGADAIAPEPPVVKGKCFEKWDKNFTNVIQSMVVNAVYGPCKFEVTFNGLDGKPLQNAQDKDGNPLDNPQIVEEGKSATVPKDPEPVGGSCFDGWSKNTDDYTNVTRKMTVSAYSKVCEYTVTFTYLEKDGTPGKKSQTVEYNKSATPPSNDDIPKTDDGQCFDYWDADFSKITDDLTVPAKYKTCTYTVRFMYTDNKGVPHIEKTETVEHGKSATAPDVPKKMDDLCFISWNPSFSNVTGKLDVTAKYDICKYTVKFVYVDADGVNAEKVETVVHGNDVTGPDDVAKKIGDQCFAGWKGDLTNVTSDMTLEPEYKLCAVSSSSVAQSSSSVVASSSSEVTPASSNAESSSSVETNSSSAVVQSSSSVKKNSSSSAIQSSSSKAKSSSSKGGSSSSQKAIYEIAAPKAKQDGSALRMVLEDSTTKLSNKVDCHIQVVSDVGVYLDTVVTGKLVDKSKNSTWRLDPAPAGDYSVNFTFTNGEDSVTYKKKFSAPKQKNLETHSWQTLSMYAFCQDDKDDCMSALNSLVARESENSETSVYWWDETNPVGDYWQYRKFSVNDKFDSTRGYWYGPMDNEPLVMSLKTPDPDAEIVWKLQNKYSGWNLVANPFGWYVKLPKTDDLTFRYWNSEEGQYEPIEILGPYEAVWVQTDKSRTLRIPLKAAIVLESENNGLAKSAASEDWNLRVVLADDKGKRDSWNELAVGSAKSMGEPPAGMGDRVNLSIVEGKQRFAKNVKKNGDNLEWNLEASATTPRAGHLSFVGLESVWAKGLHVYATIGDETVEIVNDKPLDVQLSSKAKNVSVRVSKAAVSVNIAKNWLSGFRVNQTSNMLNVGFDAAAKLAGANVKVSVVGIDGRIVARGRSIANAGSNVVSMKKPKQGIYFVRTQVGSQSAITRIMVTP